MVPLSIGIENVDDLIAHLEALGKGWPARSR